DFVDGPWGSMEAIDNEGYSPDIVDPTSGAVVGHVDTPGSVLLMPTSGSPLVVYVPGTAPNGTSGYVTLLPPPFTCGHGVLEPGEQCDDGNAIDGDGCDSNCTPTGCGNGVVTAGEICDDGNTTSGDGCSADCGALCGNGIQEPGESCDDGNLVDGDG